MQFKPILEIVKTKDKLHEMVEWLQGVDGLTLSADLETTALDVRTAEIVGHCFSGFRSDDLRGYYLPVRHRDIGVFPDGDFLNFEDIDYAEAILTTDLYEAKKLRKVWFNMKYDLNVAFYNGIHAQNNVDAMILMFLRNENERNHQLKTLAKKYVDPSADVDQKKVADCFKTLQRIVGKDKANYGMIPINILGPYGALDAVLTLMLWGKYNVYIAPEDSPKKDGLRQSILEHELRYTEIVCEMERDGFPFDVSVCEALEEPIQEACSQLGTYLNSLAGCTFNPDSDQDTAHVLERLGFEPFAYSKLPGRENVPSWGRTELMKLNNELGECLACYRNLSHSLSTFIRGLPRHVVDGRIHCSYNQIGARTGRASTNNPNLQGIAKRMPKYSRVPEYAIDALKLAFEIRKAFIAPPGYKVLSVDESQFELRALAHYCKDERLCRAFADGRDIHAFAASLMFNEAYDVFMARLKAGDSETDRQRDICKHINFAIIYGAGFRTLRDTMAHFGITMSVTDVRNFYFRYMDIFTNIKEFVNLVQSTVRRRGYVFNHYGRHKRVPANKAYVGVNYLIQGVTADMLKDAKIRIHDKLEDLGAKSWIALAVHDEVDFILHEDEMDLIPVICKEMEDFPWCSVPIKAEAKIGPSWGELKNV